jgi:hypothetical protein
LGGLFRDNILLVDGSSGDIDFSNQPDELGSFGFINYVLGSGDGDIFIRSELDEDAAAPGTAALPATLSAVAAIFHKPSSAFTTGCNDPGPDQRGFGSWGRANGGSIDTDFEGTSTINGRDTVLRTKNRTDFYGIQAGFDTAFCNINNRDLTIHTGVTGGYVEGTSNQRNGGFTVDFDSYFVGLYGALSRGAASAEATVRYDNHSFDLSHDDPTIIAPGTDSGGETFSAMVTGSYEFSLSELTKIIPSGGFTISNTSVDAFRTSGGVAEFDDLVSVMGFAGITATTTVPVRDNFFLLPFASATLYNEFADNGKSGFTLGLTTADIDTDRIGTFGQLGIGINAVRVGNTAAGESNVYGSLRFDAQIGEQIEGWGVTGAVRIQF